MKHNHQEPYSQSGGKVRRYLSLSVILYQELKPRCTCFDDPNTFCSQTPPFGAQLKCIFLIDDLNVVLLSRVLLNITFINATGTFFGAQF